LRILSQVISGLLIPNRRGPGWFSEVLLELDSVDPVVAAVARVVRLLASDVLLHVKNCLGILLKLDLGTEAALVGVVLGHHQRLAKGGCSLEA